MRIDADRLSRERAAELKALLGRHPGNCAVSVRAVIPEQSETKLAVPLKIQPSDDLIESVRKLGFEVELH
jgi:DNA polymerase-3 subunit alpha